MTMPRVKDKELAKIVKLVVRTPGWDVRQTRSNHLQILAPGGGIITTGTTPSDHRAVKNTLARMRGFGWS